MDRDVQRYWSGVALGGVTVLAAVLLVMLVIELRVIIGVVFLGIILGLTLSPLTDYLARYRVPRVLSVLVVYLGLAGLLAIFVWYAGQELTREFEDFDEELDTVRRDYNDFADDRSLPSYEDIEDFVRDNIGGIGGDAVNQAVNAVSGLFYVFTIFFVALLFTVSKERMRAAVLPLIGPRQRDRTGEVLDTIGTRLRRFVVAEAISMFVVGALSYIGLTIIGARFPLVLATIAFIFELLPTIGPWIAYIPALAIALTDGVMTAVKVSALYLAIQAIENYVLVPLIHGRHGEIPALLIIIAILVGGALMGILGALIAIPAALILHTLYFDVFVPWRRDQVRREEERQRQARKLRAAQ